MFLCNIVDDLIQPMDTKSNPEVSEDDLEHDELMEIASRGIFLKTDLLQIQSAFNFILFSQMKSRPFHHL